MVAISKYGFYWYLFQRIHLDIQVGEHANDYQEIAAKDKLTELQLRIRQLLDQVEQISKEQNYQRVRVTEHLFKFWRRFINNYRKKKFFSQKIPIVNAIHAYFLKIL